MGNSRGNVAIDSARKLDEELRSDVEHWLSEFKAGKKDQLSRRSFARAVFAFMEGVVFGLKRLTLEFSADGDGPLSPQESALLLEEGAEADDNGVVVVKPVYVRFRANLRFAFKQFAKITKTPYSLDVSGVGWGKLCASIKIRDRLMHPKTTTDIVVTDDELSVVKESYEWFAKVYSELFVASILASAAETARLKEDASRLESRINELGKNLEETSKTSDG